MFDVSVSCTLGLIIWELSARARIAARLDGLKFACNGMNVSSRAEMEYIRQMAPKLARFDTKLKPQSNWAGACAKRFLSPGWKKSFDYMRNLSPFKRAGNPSPPSLRREEFQPALKLSHVITKSIWQRDDRLTGWKLKESAPYLYLKIHLTWLHNQ